MHVACTLVVFLILILGPSLLALAASSDVSEDTPGVAQS